MSEQRDARALAREALTAMDALLAIIEGGTALDVLVDAREALNSFVNQKPTSDDKALTVHSSTLDGITFVRGNRYFTIHDQDLEQVREAVNARKRELRKRQRREKASGTR